MEIYKLRGDMEERNYTKTILPGPVSLEFCLINDNDL